MGSIIVTSVTHCDNIQWYSLHYFTPLQIKHCICHLLWELWGSLDSSAVIYMSIAWCPCTWTAESGSYWLPTEASCARWIFIWTVSLLLPPLGLALLTLSSFYPRIELVVPSPDVLGRWLMNHEGACIWPWITWGFWPLSQKVINQVTPNLVYWLVWPYQWLGCMALMLSHWCF